MSTVCVWCWETKIFCRKYSDSVICYLPTMRWVIMKLPTAQCEPKWWHNMGLTLQIVLGTPWAHKYVKASPHILVTFSREISWTLSELQQILEAEELYKSCISSVVLRGDHSGEQTFIHHHCVPCHVLTMVGVISHWSYFRLLVKGDRNVWVYLNVTCRCSTWSVSVMKSQSSFQSSSWDPIFNIKAESWLFQILMGKERHA